MKLVSRIMKLVFGPISLLIALPCAHAQEWLCKKPACTDDDICIYYTNPNAYARCSLEHLEEVIQKLDEKSPEYFLERDEVLNYRDSLNGVDALLTTITTEIVAIVDESLGVSEEFEFISKEYSSWNAKANEAIKANAPNWANVCKPEFLKALQTSLANLKNAIPEDTDLITRMSMAFDRYRLLAARLDEVEIELFGLKFQEKVSDVFSTVRALQQKLTEQYATMRALDSIRSRVTEKIELTWQQFYQRAINNKIVCNLADNTIRALNDPFIYGRINAMLSNISAELNSLFSLYYAPRIARGRLHMLAGLLEDVKSNLPKLPITENNRRNIQALIDGGWATLRAYSDRITQMREIDYEDFLDMRVSKTSRVLSGLGDRVSSECRELASTVDEMATGIESEMAFQEVMTRCVK